MYTIKGPLKLPIPVTDSAPATIQYHILWYVPRQQLPSHLS